ncbi:UDP-N-acetylmuramate dehydrogenase [Desulfobacterota bacterium AH_259_B03_O07]|nr:UDP-N-acetylmuramate dehydrogenase [Desulfobacterota bacterium AH_259_B03_O07]
MKGLLTELDNLGCEYIENYSMKRFTSLRVGGEADLLVSPQNYTGFLRILNILSSLDLRWVVLGGGSNTIVADSGLRGVVIVTKKLRNIEIMKDGIVLAESGAVLGTILKNTIDAGLTGFEFAAGIPGTVGGGIFMNAGANGGEIKDVVERVWIWLDGKEEVLSRDEIQFEYRKSNLPKGSVVTKAMFKLRSGNRKESKRSVRDYMDKRSETQPIKMSNTGSIFKNPPEIPAGKLLDELGFKGVGIGGARFSEIHANFIVNSGHAYTSDILKLIEIAKEQAFLRRGVKLETEVRIIRIIGEELN